jgi:hypothetical protein
MTIFCDIDGTLVPQQEGLLEELHPASALPGVEKLKAAYAAGAIIVLTTARPELLRGFTKREMKRLGIPYHHLLMGLGNTPRVLINNLRDGDATPTATAFNVPMNGGLEGVTL